MLYDDVFGPTSGTNRPTVLDGEVLTPMTMTRPTHTGRSDERTVQWRNTHGQLFTSWVRLDRRVVRPKGLRLRVVGEVVGRVAW